MNPSVVYEGIDELINSFIKAISFFQSLLDLSIHFGWNVDVTVELMQEIEMVNDSEV